LIQATYSRKLCRKNRTYRLSSVAALYSSDFGATHLATSLLIVTTKLTQLRCFFFFFSTLNYQLSIINYQLSINYYLFVMHSNNFLNTYSFVRSNVEFVFFISVNLFTFGLSRFRIDNNIHHINTIANKYFLFGRFYNKICPLFEV